MEGRLNINVSTVDYEKTSAALIHQLTLLEEMVHGEDDFVVTDSEFALGWHFFVASVNRTLVARLKEQMGPAFEGLRGRGDDKKFLSWLESRLGGQVPRFKLAIKEEMESSKYGLF
ncbi:MAG: hypothetical protein J4G04_07710 [Nitrosopumilaceae archaeon]|nr:hypothetical protein [Nitrosopumilaceae archaeon]